LVGHNVCWFCWLLGVVSKVKNRRHSVYISKKLVTVKLRKFRIFVLVSNRIEYWSNYSILFGISNIRTPLVVCESNRIVIVDCGWSAICCACQFLFKHKMKTCLFGQWWWQTLSGVFIWYQSVPFTDVYTSLFVWYLHRPSPNKLHLGILMWQCYFCM